MKITDSTLVSSSHRYWNGKTDGMHPSSKEEWFDQAASEILAILKPRGILVDVGCGSCQVTTYLAKEFEQVYAFDFSETMLLAGRQRIKSLGLTNIQLCGGSAREFPKTVSLADVILSYGVVQYLTLSEFGQHLRECRRVLANDGIVCTALIPNVKHRNSYYRKKVVPEQIQFAPQLRRWLRLTQRRVKAFVERDLLWDGIGNWFEKEDIQKTANEAGFEVEFRSSWFYDYRYHALLWPKSS